MRKTNEKEPTGEMGRTLNSLIKEAESLGEKQ